MNKRIILQLLLPPIVKQNIPQPRIPNSLAGRGEVDDDALVVVAEAHGHLAYLHADGDAFDVAVDFDDMIFFL
jgi:hypothetical protein